jgi:hypothetical protein|tara:strand:- start:3976 stop:4209 length:234 start_codon:yes stop_codon:yes gene_type:complete
MLLHLATTNDSNGNPRRGWAEFNDHGMILNFFEEGYSGSAALPERLRELRYAAPTITVAPREYRNWVKAAQANNTEA